MEGQKKIQLPLIKIGAGVQFIVRILASTLEAQGLIPIISYLKAGWGQAGEMARWLRTLAALTEDLSYQRPHSSSQQPVTLLLGDPMPTCDF